VEVTIDDNDDNDKDDSDSSLDDFTADLNTQLYDEDSNNLDSQSMIPPRPAPLIAASYDFALPSVENVAPPLDIIQNGYVEEPSRSTPESYLAMLTEPLQSAPSTSDTNRWDPGQVSFHNQHYGSYHSTHASMTGRRSIKALPTFNHFSDLKQPIRSRTHLLRTLCSQCLHLIPSFQMPQATLL
jgi:hypothetical protein